MSKPKTSHSGQQAADSAKGKKSAPINHVILKRIGDIKTLVSDLVDSNEDKAIAGLDLGQEIHKHTSEIEALRNELHQFQSGMLNSFCDALDQRLTQSSVVNAASATEQTSELSIPAVTSSASILPAATPSAAQPAAPESTADSKVAGTDGLKEDSWESIRSAFLVEHEIPAETEAESLPENCTSDDVQSLTPADALNAFEDSLPTHIDNVEDSEADLDFKHSDIIADLDSLDETTLRSVVAKQEQLILGLIRRLRTKHSNRPTLTAEQLQSVKQFADDKLADEIGKTLAVLHNQQRHGELELSLERAKLSRRRTDLEQLEARIEGRARTLGVTITDDGSLEEVALAERGTGTKSRRWLGAMGFGNS